MYVYTENNQLLHNRDERELEVLIIHDKSVLCKPGCGRQCFILYQ